MNAITQKTWGGEISKYSAPEIKLTEVKAELGFAASGEDFNDSEYDGLS